MSDVISTALPLFYFVFEGDDTSGSDAASLPIPDPMLRVNRLDVYQNEKSDFNDRFKEKLLRLKR